MRSLTASRAVRNQSSSGLALAAVVTESTVAEFELMKFSFELYHGENFSWFVRCDQASAAPLSRYDNVNVTAFADRVAKRPSTDSPAFKDIAVQKMNAIDDAWLSSCTHVAFLDSDLVFTSSVVDCIWQESKDLILTTNHYPQNISSLASRFGYYNGGFIVTGNRKFAPWWRNTFLGSDTTFDQLCLNRLPEDFQIELLGTDCNIGFWGSLDMEWRKVVFEDLPEDCKFFHVHLFQPLLEERGWLDKLFALHCLRFLHASSKAGHRILLQRILEREEAAWYRQMLRAYERRAAFSRLPPFERVSTHRRVSPS